MTNQSTPAGTTRVDDGGLKDAPQHHSDCSQRDHHCQPVIVRGWHSVDAGCTCPICVGTTPRPAPGTPIELAYIGPPRDDADLGETNDGRSGGRDPARNSKHGDRKPRQ